MKTKLIILLTLFSVTNFVQGQSKQETLNMLEKRALLYLNQMYSEQKFDIAYKNWDDSVFRDIEEIYKEKKDTISDRLSLVKRIKSDYQKFYNTNKNFTKIKFISKDIFNENNYKIAAFQYTYNEEIYGKFQNSERFIYFIWDKMKSKWKILDYRITEVLINEPNKWLY